MITEELLPAMQGVFPSTIVTSSPDGIPNTTIVSQVFYVDEHHVALSFQFFNKTIRNVRQNPKAVVQIVHANTLEVWNLNIEYEHSQEKGPVFDQMDMQLEAIASMTGMSGVFKLRAADIYRVKHIQKV